MTEPCPYCRGSGRCQECAGHRYIDDGPHGVTHCWACNGTGQCHNPVCEAGLVELDDRPVLQT